MMSLYSNAVLVFLRTLTGFIAGGALTLYVMVLFKGTDYRFPSRQIWMTTLPIVGLSIAVLWAILAIPTLFIRAPAVKIFHITCDSLVVVTVTVLGVVGFVHDDEYYLSNAQWRVYDQGPWLSEEVIASILEIIVVVFQLLIGILTIFAYKSAKRAERSMTEAMGVPEYVPQPRPPMDTPPAYVEEYGKRDGLGFRGSEGSSGQSSLNEDVKKK